MSTCRGADVSAIQSTGDWTGYDLAFVIAKASEGRTTRDARFAAHMTAARMRGMVPGGYHFGWPVQAVADEAANYVGAVKAQASAGVFTHWLDLEAYSDRRNVGSMRAAQIRSWATSWIATVKTAFPGQRVGVYASLATFQVGWVPTTADAYWVAQYPVAGLTWAAAEARARPTLPVAYTKPLIWQFGSTSPALDRDLAYLSSSDLAAWASKEDDVALTADDKKWLTDTIDARLKALVYPLVWQQDLMAAPSTASDVQGNPTRTPENVLRGAYDSANNQGAAIQQAIGAVSTGGLADEVAAQLSELEITVTKKEPTS